MKLPRWSVALIVAAPIAAVLSAAAQDASRQNVSLQPAGEGAGDDVEQGRTLYAEHCSHCHGFNMVNPGTVTFDLRRFPPDDKPRFVNSVTHGKDNRMPPWGDVLTTQDIDALWAYISTGGKS